jgi:uncharacterized protein YdaU (DUF1376 family)
MTLPWYRRFPDRFITGTIHLSLEEKGAYSLLLDMMYARGGPVPDEPRHIAGVLNCSVRKWNSIRQRLIDIGKIATAEGYLMNMKAEEEIAISGKISREAAENGAKGGNKTAEKRAETNKNNDLAPAKGQLSTSTTNKKEKIASPDPTEGTVRLDRNANAPLFQACEQISGISVPEYQTGKSWPASIYNQAVALIGAATKH